jgi:hypothetical protein
MIKKSLHITLCMSTVFNSLAFSMDGPLQKPPQLNKKIQEKTQKMTDYLDENHLTAFYQEVSSTYGTLTRDTMGETQRSFMEGGREAFLEYVKDMQDFFSKLKRGEFLNLSTSTMMFLFQQHFNTVIEKYQSKHKETHEKGEIDHTTLTKLFELIRAQTYKTLLKSGLYGGARQVWVVETDTIQTQQDVTTETRLSVSILNAILPEITPIREVIVALAHNRVIDKFLLARLDKVFATMTLQFFAKFTGKNVADLFPLIGGAIGLSGLWTLQEAHRMLTTDYPDVDHVPELTKESMQSLSKIWDYLEPRFSHYIRLGLVETLTNLMKFTVDKSLEPVVLKLARAMSTFSYFTLPVQLFLIPPYFYQLGESLTPLPVVDGVFGLGVGMGAIFLINGLTLVAAPGGLSQAQSKIVDLMNEWARLFAEYYTYQLLPLSRQDHVLYKLKTAPSEVLRSLFQEDYELRDKLQAESFLMAVFQDLSKGWAYLFENIPFISNAMTTILKAIQSNPHHGILSHLALLNPRENYVPSSHFKTAALIRFYRIIATLEKNKRGEEAFRKASLLTRVVNYVKGASFKPESLLKEDQELWEDIRKYPSFEMRKGELELLSTHFTWLSQSDKKNKQEPHDINTLKLSQEFVNEAIDLINQLDEAIKNLKGIIDNPKEELTKLQTALPFEEYLAVLHFINQTSNETLQTSLGETNRELKGLLEPYILKTEFQDLYTNHLDLVQLIRTTSLGMGLTYRQQLERAKDLSSKPNVLEKLQKEIAFEEKSIEQLEAPALWQRYRVYRNQYLIYFYKTEFIKVMGPAYFTNFANRVLREMKKRSLSLTSKGFYTVIDSVYEQDSETNGTVVNRFRVQLQDLLQGNDEEARSLRSHCHVLVRGHIKKTVTDLWNKQDQSTKVTNERGFFSFFTGSEKPGTPQESQYDESASEKPGTPQESQYDESASEKPGTPQESQYDESSCLVPPLSCRSSIPFLSMVEDGAEAFFIAQTIEGMLSEKPEIFEGRTGTELIERDFDLVSQKINQIRLTHVLTSDVMRLIEQYKRELAHLVSTHRQFKESCLWVYDDLVEVLTGRSYDLLNEIKNPTGLEKITIINDYTLQGERSDSQTSS